jgi:hypothetical protein
MDNEIRFNKQALNKLLDDVKYEGMRQGYTLAIDTLRNKEFIETFEVDTVEAAICAEALFLNRDKSLDG